MRKKLMIFGLSIALVLGMILVSLGDIPLILPIDLFLNSIADVNAGTPTDKDALIWDSTTAKWIPEARSTMANSIDLNDLGDVNAGAPNDNDALTWDTGTSKWIPEAVAAGVSEEDIAFLDNFDDASRHWGWFDDNKNGTIAEAGELLTLSIGGTVNGRIGDGTLNNGPRVLLGDPGAPFEVKVKLNSYTVNDFTHAGIFVCTDSNSGGGTTWFFFGRARDSGFAINGLGTWTGAGWNDGFNNAVQTMPIYLRFRIIVMMHDVGARCEAAYSTDDISYTVLHTFYMNNLVSGFLQSLTVGIFTRNGVGNATYNAIAAPFEWYKMGRTLGPG